MARQTWEFPGVASRKSKLLGSKSWKSKGVGGAAISDMLGVTERDPGGGGECPRDMVSMPSTASRKHRLSLVYLTVKQVVHK